MDDLSIRQILEGVNNGNLRVPAFQRGFVWDADRVAHLMDSIYKGYPIGSLLIWRTSERLKYEKELGPFQLPTHDDAYPVDYILDGQQRMTSIYGVFFAGDRPTEDFWNKIYYDFGSEADPQDSQFFSIEPSKVDLQRFFPITTLFDTIAYRKATRELSDELAERIDALQAIFKEAKIPVQMLETDNRTTVAIVFERVNQRGVELDTLQLLTAWTWSEEFDLQREFETLQADLEAFGFRQTGEDSNLLLRCCSAVIAHDANVDSLIKLNGAEVRERFSEVSNGIKGAIDFLKSNLDVHSINNLPFPNLLVPLSAFFSISGNKQFQYSSTQRHTLLRWFWRSCFGKRYTSQPIKTIRTDIEEMMKLRVGKKNSLADTPCNKILPELFKRERFRLDRANSKTFILLLAQNKPLSFITGSPVSLSEVLLKYNKNEFHHLFTKTYLRSASNKNKKHHQDCLANICFMSRSDNNKLGGEKPSIYRAYMPKDSANILERAYCPSSLFEDNFDKFISDRAEWLAKEANARAEIEPGLSIFD